jgi:hypothetical protein
MNHKIRFKTTKRASGKYEYTNHEWDISAQLNIHDFLKNNPKMDFENAGILIENPKKASGFQISLSEKWKNTKYILYILVINGKVAKGGKSKNELSKRSYDAGTEHNWTVTGEASPTNYVYSQIFRESLKNGDKVEFYCCKCPFEMREIDMWGEVFIKKQSTYEEMEIELNKRLFNALGRKLIGDGKLMEQFKS